MNVMLAQNRYPRAGDVAILCEGDVAGFEVDLIEKWIATRAPQVLADVWACGTQESIFGMADAIGRSRPLVVVEDRDYRTQEQAKADCEKKQKDRLKRAVEVGVWRTWARNEIENYLIEPAVVVPVVAGYFRISDPQLVRERLESVVVCLRVDQAAQFALNQFRYSIPSKSRYIGGLPRKTARPYWSAEQGTMVAPEMALVRAALEKELKKKAELHIRDSTEIDFGKFVCQFESKCNEWSHVTCSSPIWLVDWAGKDIVVSLCRWLAAEFGIFGFPDHHQRQVDWDALAGEKNPDGSPTGSDQEIERRMIHDLQPALVESFLEQLPNMGGDVQQEWESLVDAIQQATIT